MHMTSSDTTLQCVICTYLNKSPWRVIQYQCIFSPWLCSQKVHMCVRAACPRTHTPRFPGNTTETGQVAHKFFISTRAQTSIQRLTSYKTTGHSRSRAGTEAAATHEQRCREGQNSRGKLTGHGRPRCHREEGPLRHPHSDTLHITHGNRNRGRTKDSKKRIRFQKANQD